MVHGENRIPYRIDRSLTGLAGPEYHAIISFGLPIEPEDSQHGEYRVEFHQGIAQIAKALIREALIQGWSLRPADAIHLATAKWLADVG